MRHTERTAQALIVAVCTVVGGAWVALPVLESAGAGLELAERNPAVGPTMAVRETFLDPHRARSYRRMGEAPACGLALARSSSRS